MRVRNRCRSVARWILQGWADEAAAAGDERNHQRNVEQVTRLKAMRYPWEQSAA
jgi:hypothetical protein